MDGTVGSFQVAIVGSGPSGFYAAEALLRSTLPVHIDMFERLPTPFGLVRSGVAPDHQKLKQPIQVFERIARAPEFSFLGNITVGADITIDALKAAYHAVIFACGAQNDRRIGIPGEDLKGSHTATEFVGWYNGHPDYRDRIFDLKQDVVAIVGQGNVAADVCRILTRPVDELAISDIAEHALDALAESEIREVHIIGRRGPAQAKFTTKELRELTQLTGTIATIDAAELELSEICRVELASPSNVTAQKNMGLFKSLTGNVPQRGARRIHFRFLASPSALLGRDRVEQLSLVRNRLTGEAFAQIATPTQQFENIACGLVFRSIGYKGVPIPGMPFDASRGLLPNVNGRVTQGDTVLPGFYVTGWLKRGPSGIIGTNRADSIETVDAVLSDLMAEEPRAAPGLRALLPMIERRCPRVVHLSDWFDIDTAEVERGRIKGKPREKFTRISEMLAVLS
ncbi:FAD-dependent oxidoreductase [Hyphomicrobium sp.]|uniref:FAD-dependent oxidoreductase n=1 Tax=Hyphomicrobium sp. TaxID=82 RepID=UPI0025C133E6|nr:FAD-dependent oxidoreductase [Hyphomicrobium sp.]MCC7252147.1 FAD-dependent oxidoreductase [Hyphomicrobium sp.]